MNATHEFINTIETELLNPQSTVWTPEQQRLIRYALIYIFKPPSEKIDPFMATAEVVKLEASFIETGANHNGWLDVYRQHLEQSGITTLKELFTRLYEVKHAEMNEYRRYQKNVASGLSAVEALTKGSIDKMQADFEAVLAKIYQYFPQEINQTDFIAERLERLHTTDSKEQSGGLFSLKHERNRFNN